MNSADSKHYFLTDILLDLEMALRDAGVWDCKQPSEEAMQSKEPFCIDTMHFDQWLRFIMIERFRVLIETGGNLPEHCHVSPMAMDAFKDCAPDKLQQIIHQLDRVDQHLSDKKR